MKKTYYLFNPGRIERKDNSLKFIPTKDGEPTGKPKFIPIKGVSDIYVFGSLDANSAIMNFLGRQQIAVHYFGYYEHYTGSYMPKEYLLAGKMQIHQTQHYSNEEQRLTLAKAMVTGSGFNMQKNLKYYVNRDRPVQTMIDDIDTLMETVEEAERVQSLMGLEGNMRKIYYRGFDEIIKDFEMKGRSKQPPENEINALVSFGNMMCYTLVLGQIYHTQLNPTISFLHEPGTRRYSLALDLAEIFKPLLVDRTIFSLVNRRMIKKDDFDRSLNGCLLKEKGRKTFVKAFDERLDRTIEHRGLGRKVSYKRLVRLECYKLAKHMLDMEPYEPFKAWW